VVQFLTRIPPWKLFSFHPTTFQPQSFTSRQDTKNTFQDLSVYERRYSTFETYLPIKTFACLSKDLTVPRTWRPSPQLHLSVYQTTPAMKYITRSKRPPLLSLPPEIRNHIWTFVVVRATTVDPEVRSISKRLELHVSKTEYLSSSETILALARTCKQLHDEVLPIYFGKNRFEFRDTSALCAFLNGLSWQRRQYIREVEVWCHVKISLSPLEDTEHRANFSSRKGFALLGECKGLRK